MGSLGWGFRRFHLKYRWKDFDWNEIKKTMKQELNNIQPSALFIIIWTFWIQSRPFLFGETVPLGFNMWSCFVTGDRLWKQFWKDLLLPRGRMSSPSLSPGSSTSWASRMRQSVPGEYSTGVPISYSYYQGSGSALEWKAGSGSA